MSTDTTLDRHTADLVEDLTRQTAEIQPLEGARAHLEPAEARLRLRDLEGLDAQPTHARGTATMQRVVDLQAYLAEHHSQSTTVWVDERTDPPVVAAVLDDHGAAEPAWGEHRAHLQLQPTAEWARWSGRDGRTFSQEEFAEHIEVSQRDIIAPDAAEMLEVAQTLNGSTSITWRSSQRLSNGQRQATYHENVEGTAGHDGALDIPTELRVRLAPFVGEEIIELTARLRYRVRNGQISFTYNIDHAEEVVQRVVDGLVDRLTATGHGRVYRGQPIPRDQRARTAKRLPAAQPAGA